jgi:hypothetical protein
MLLRSYWPDSGRTFGPDGLSGGRPRPYVPGRQPADGREMPDIPETPIYNEILDVIKQDQPVDQLEDWTLSTLSREELIRYAAAAMRHARVKRVHFDDEGSYVVPGAGE